MPKDPLDRFIKDRTRETFDEVVRAHGPRTLQAACGVLGDHPAAEDAAQTVFADGESRTVPFRIENGENRTLTSTR